MAASPPFRIPLAKRSSHTTSVAECSRSSPPLSLNLNWKTPTLANRARKSTPTQTFQDEPEEEEGAIVQLPSLPSLNWRTPVIQDPPADSFPEDSVTLVPPIEDPHGLPSSSSFTVDEDEGAYELESVLLEEEEYNVAEYSRHRKETGLGFLDDEFGLERHPLLQEEDRQRGLASGSTLEVAGTPGSGKTTLVLQMAIRERLNGLLRVKNLSTEKGKAEEEGKEGDVDWMTLGEKSQQVMLIDTEGSIGMDRIVGIARGHIEALNFQPPNKSALLRSLLAGIHYCRSTSEVELLALFQTLLPSSRRIFSSLSQPSRSSNLGDRDEKTSLAARLPLRTSMVVIDTISYPVRAPIPDEARHLRNQRNEVINELKQFTERCSRRGINVILANQMSFTIVSKEGLTTTLSDKDGEGRFVPLLRNQGESILGANIWRIALFRAGKHSAEACSRFAHIIGRPVSVVNKKEVEAKTTSNWLPLFIDHRGISEFSFVRA